MIAATAISHLNTSLNRFYESAAKIADPDRLADVGDIVDMKSALHEAKVGAKVLKKVNESQEQLVNIIA